MLTLTCGPRLAAEAPWWKSSCYVFSSSFSLQVSDITVTHQTVGLSTQEPGDIFIFSPFDGILGLSYSSLASKYSVPIFDNMMNRRLIAEDLFSVYMSR